MHNLIEFYEMISMNDAALGRGERMAILRAQLALSMFTQAMHAFKRAAAEEASATDSTLALAA